MTSTRAAIPLLLLGLMALLGVGGWGAVHYGVFSGETKRANVATKTTEALVAVTATQDAKAGAVFAKIGETNTEAPDSPQKRVIARFVTIGGTLTGEPDAAFMLELEKLKSAMLQGKIDQADKINADILKDTGELRRELTQAIAAKRASDMEGQIHAAEARGEAEQKFWLACIAVAALALYVYCKLTHVSPGSLARIVSDIRIGNAETNPALQSIDALTSPLQQWMVKGNVWFNSKLAKLFT